MHKKMRVEIWMGNTLSFVVNARKIEYSFDGRTAIVTDDDTGNIIETAVQNILIVYKD